MPRLAFLPFLLLLCLCTLACNRPAGRTAAATGDSLDYKIGQLLLAGLRGKTLDTNTIFKEQLRQGKIGGVILFDYDVPLKKADRNIESPAQVRRLIEQLQAAAPTPLLLAIDQEGGRVQRLKPAYGFAALPSAQYLGKLNNLDSTAHYAGINAEQLNELGFHVNFGPVVDVNTNPQNPVIGGIERSYGADPAVVTRQAETVIREYREHDIIPVLKHFPGHGSSTADSHKGITDVSETWRRLELQPYEQLVEKGLVDAVMTAHVFNRHLDPQYPATLSRRTMGIMRDSLGFDGVIFSDDMQMKAISSEYGLEQALVLALNAGIDMIVFGNNLDFDPYLPDKFHAIVKAAVERGDIPRERIDEAYRRVRALKGKAGVLRAD